MGKQTIVAAQIQQLCSVFRSSCEDVSTLDEVAATAGDRGRWRRAHDLFDRVRKKNLAAARRGDVRVADQYDFEEICAKAIHNLGAFPAPFDSDSQYWVIPRALRLARQLGIPDARVLEITTEPTAPPDAFGTR